MSTVHVVTAKLLNHYPVPKANPIINFKLELAKKLAASLTHMPFLNDPKSTKTTEGEKHNLFTWVLTKDIQVLKIKFSNKMFTTIIRHYSPFGTQARQQGDNGGD